MSTGQNVQMRRCWPTQKHIYDAAIYVRCPYCARDAWLREQISVYKEKYKRAEK
jgi:hypothetical protein